MGFNLRRLWVVWAVVCLLGGVFWWAWEYSKIENRIFLTKAFETDFDSTVAHYMRQQEALPLFIGPIIVVLIAAPAVLLKVWRWTRITP
jgi:hypothetical protein